MMGRSYLKLCNVDDDFLWEFLSVAVHKNDLIILGNRNLRWWAAGNAVRDYAKSIECCGVYPNDDFMFGGIVPCSVKVRSGRDSDVSN